MEFDALTLSRLQFAFTIASHIIFPAFTIGLASWLVSLEFKWLGTGSALYRNLFRFWGDGGVSNDGLRRRGHVGLDDSARL
jgi:cytochrome d ubiquinol oxidase subunit I